MSFLPGWDSADTTAAIAHNLHITAIVVLGLLVVSEALALIYDSRKEHLASVAALNAAAQRKSVEVAAKKKSDVEAAQLRLELAAAQKVATEAAEKAKELDRLRQPRRLTGNQKTRLFDFAANAPKGKLKIKASANAPDARGYADEIAAVFVKAGWDAPVDNAMFMGGDTSGIWITVRTATIPPVAHTVYSALKEAEISIRDGASGDENGPAADEVWLNIGLIK